MLEIDRNADAGINPFVTSLSVVNFMFAFTMNLFSFTIFSLLQSVGIPIIYGGLGISVGQALIFLVVIPQGRLIDRGKSYFLMIAGSILYAVALILIFFDVLAKQLIFYYLVAALVSLIIIAQNMYKASLSSFVGKAVKSTLIGKNYSRIIMMETAGGTASFFIILFGINFVRIQDIYLYSGISLFLFVIATFTFLFREHRQDLVTEESKVRRPTLIESMKALAYKRRFLTPIFLTKIFMSIGTLAYSYFFIVLGEKIGIPERFSLIFLGVSYAIAVPFGLYSERFVDKHRGMGKGYIVLMAFTDLVIYVLMLIALIYGNKTVFLLSALIGAPGPLVVSGALSYELKVVGKESRGMFGALQRTLVAIPAIVVAVPLTILFKYNFTFMWLIIVVTAFIALISSILIPSKEYLVEKFGIEGISN